MTSSKRSFASASHPDCAKLPKTGKRGKNRILCKVPQWAALIVLIFSQPGITNQKAIVLMSKKTLRQLCGPSVRQLFLGKNVLHVFILFFSPSWVNLVASNSISCQYPQSIDLLQCTLVQLCKLNQATSKGNSIMVFSFFLFLFSYRLAGINDYHQFTHWFIWPWKTYFSFFFFIDHCCH